MRWSLALLLLTCVPGFSQLPKSLVDANRRWLDCAKAGKASCQFSLGRAMITAKPPDFENGLAWLSKGAAQNNADAQNRLGIVYMNGEGVTRDYGRAREYYLAAARNGSAPGKANIGLMYWRGYGVEANLPEAFAWSDISSRDLPSGAKQRNDILAAMTPEEWGRGRDRSAQLLKEYPVSGPSWWSQVGRAIDAAEPYFAGLVFIVVIISVGRSAIQAKRNKEVQALVRGDSPKQTRDPKLEKSAPEHFVQLATPGDLENMIRDQKLGRKQRRANKPRG